MQPKATPAFAVGSPLKKISTTPSLACGQSFAAMVAPDGSLWGWGDSSQAHVASGERPQRIGNETDWQSVTAGFYGFIALKKDGSIWGMGQNGEGLLGVTNSTLKKLTQLNKFSDWADVQAGVAHCMALKKNGALWVWGRNGYGEMGLGKTSPSELPVRFGTDNDWKAITPGDFHCYALKQDGTIWAWGLDFITSRNLNPTQLGPDTNWVAISSGSYHLAALKSDGSLWVIGSNTSSFDSTRSSPGTNWFQLGSSKDWVEIRSGQNNILARKKDGTWWAAGSSEVQGWGTRSADGFSKLPLPVEPLAMKSQRGTTLILMPDGRLWSLGQRIGGTDSPDPLQRISNAIAGIVNFFTGNTSSTRSTSLPRDQSPYLIWEADSSTPPL